MREISAWQDGRDSLNNPFRTCWPLLARLCSHSENPIRQETVPFRTSIWIARKEGKTVVLEGCEQRSFGLPDDLDPVQDCGRSRRNERFINGLIAWPA